MFRKLRNSFLTMNCAIIGALLVCCLGINFLMVYKGVSASIDKKLNNEIEMIERRATGHDNGWRKFGADAQFKPNVPRAEDGAQDKEAAPKSDEENPVDFGRNQSFFPTFSLITDKFGAVKEVNMAFSIAEDFYSGKVPEIIQAQKSSGTYHCMNSDGSASLWRYKRKSIADGYIIAFTEISNDMYTLRMLALCLLLIALAATVVTVFISLFFANRSIRPIEESYNRQKQFVADASHELKTPLTTINTNIDVLLSKNDMSEDDRKWLRYIKEEARRMSKLTNDLLYLARADYSAGDRLLSNVSWTDTINNVLLVMEARIFESRITLVSHIEDAVNVLASGEQLKQLIMILIDNAVKYTPEGGSIEIRLFKKASDAYMTVSNTGPGIPEEDLPHIFDRFYRSDKARTYTGNSGYGLGLAIAKALTEDFNGSITAESYNENTVFTVKIPLAKA